MSRYLLLFVLAYCCQTSNAQSPPMWGTLQPGKHRVGFQSYWEFDHARTYQMTFPDKTTYATGKAPRPILVNVWYPADPTDPVKPMAHRKYLDITSHDPRLKTFAPALIRYNRQMIIQELLKKAEDKLSADEKNALETWLDTPTAALREALPAKGQFPLVIYHSGYGSSFEDNAVLCEYLASHGFVVVGSAFQEQSGQSFNIDGKQDSGKDIAYLIHTARNLPFVDWQHVGLIGHSGGAHASLVYRAQANSPVDAVVSLDTTQDYYSLADNRWSYMTKPVLANRAHFNCPVLVAANPHAHFPLFDALTKSERYYLTLSNLSHNDFISQGVMEHGIQAKVIGKPEAEQKYQTLRREYAALCVAVRCFLQAELQGDKTAWVKWQSEHSNTPLGGALPHLEAAKAGSGTATVMTGMESLTPRLARPYLQQHGVEKTLTKLKELRATDKTSPCFHLIFAFALVFDLLEAGQMDTAKTFHAFYAEVIPEYKNFYFKLGKSFVSMGRRDDARVVLQKALQLEPQHAEARQLLGDLEAGKKK